MSKLPAVTGQEAISAFESFGFQVVRTTASHHIMKKSGHRYLLSIPVHGSKCVSDGVLRSQIRAAGLTREEFIKAV
jgi:predicted RNA binding protein YcfA (HicA-like mRNA interferase family)